MLSCFLFYSTSLSLIFVFVSVCVLPDVTGYYAPSSSHSTSGAMKSSAAKPDKQMTPRKAAIHDKMKIIQQNTGALNSGKNSRKIRTERNRRTVLQANSKG